MIDVKARRFGPTLLVALGLTAGLVLAGSPGTASGLVEAGARPSPAGVEVRASVSQKLAKCRKIKKASKRKVCILKARAKTRKVQVLDNSFRPESLTVKRYDRIFWSWKQSLLGEGHNVVLFKQPKGVNPIKFISPVQWGPTGKFARTLDRRGNYLFVCTLHNGMEFRAKVKG